MTPSAVAGSSDTILTGSLTPSPLGMEWSASDAQLASSPAPVSMSQCGLTDLDMVDSNPSNPDTTGFEVADTTEALAAWLQSLDMDTSASMIGAEQAVSSSNDAAAAMSALGQSMACGVQATPQFRCVHHFMCLTVGFRYKKGGVRLQPNVNNLIIGKACMTLQ